MPQNLLDISDEASAWLDIDGVEGVAQGEKDDQACIVVGCSLPPEALADKIPSTYKGYDVVMENWGSISALDPNH